MDQQHNTPDTIIVGAGAAGLLLAARLAEAGEHVVVIEAGPERKLGQLWSSQLWARRLKWSGAPVEESGDHKIGHAFNAGMGTGGSALHHYGVWLRLHHGDFQIASDHQRGLDWPFGYDELRPYYDRIQTEVGLSGDAKAEVWRPPGEPYPMAALPVFAQGNVLAKGFHASGKRTAPLPLAINSSSYNGRAPCQFDGWCDAGCPIGALANPLVTWLPRAQKAGVELRHNTRALRVERDPNKSGRIESLVVSGPEGRQRLHAKRFIIAAFTVQSTRILLNSAGDIPAPGNRHDQLGRYLTTHPAATVFGLFDEPTLPHLGVSGGQLISHDDYDDKAAAGGWGSSQWLIAHAVKPNDLLGYATGRADIYGPALKPWLERAAQHLGNMTVVCEDIPQANNRITLASSVDSDGAPIAAAHHDLHADTRSRWQQRTAEGQALMRAAGATDVWQGPMAPMHIMGGTVMGADDTSSVTDPWGRVHDTENLYISGPSLFPSSGAVNPTFTLSALAWRQANHLIT